MSKNSFISTRGSGSSAPTPMTSRAAWLANSMRPPRAWNVTRSVVDSTARRSRSISCAAKRASVRVAPDERVVVDRAVGAGVRPDRARDLDPAAVGREQRIGPVQIRRAGLPGRAAPRRARPRVVGARPSSRRARRRVRVHERAAARRRGRAQSSIASVELGESRRGLRDHALVGDVFERCEIAGDPAFVRCRPGAARSRAQRSRRSPATADLDDEAELEVEHFAAAVDRLERGGDAGAIIGVDRVEPALAERVFVRETEQREQRVVDEHDAESVLVTQRANRRLRSARRLAPGFERRVTRRARRQGRARRRWPSPAAVRVGARPRPDRRRAWATSASRALRATGRPRGACSARIGRADGGQFASACAASSSVPSPSSRRAVSLANSTTRSLFASSRATNTASASPAQRAVELSSVARGARVWPLGGSATSVSPGRPRSCPSSSTPSNRSTP